MDIAQRAAELSGIDLKSLLSTARFGHIVRARQAVYFVASEHGRSFTCIGRTLNRDHSTVSHGVRIAAEYAARRPGYAKFIDDLRASAT